MSVYFSAIAFFFLFLYYISYRRERDRIRQIIEGYRKIVLALFAFATSILSLIVALQWKGIASALLLVLMNVGFVCYVSHTLFCNYWHYYELLEEFEERGENLEFGKGKVDSRLNLMEPLLVCGLTLLLFLIEIIICVILESYFVAVPAIGLVISAIRIAFGSFVPGFGTSGIPGEVMHGRKLTESVMQELKELKRLGSLKVNINEILPDSCIVVRTIESYTSL